MSDSSLYQEILLDHYRRPRNFHEMADATSVERGHNPLCGDEVTLYLRIEGDVIADASFKGVSCAISRASASMMTTMIKGKTRAEADALFERFHDLVTGKITEAELDPSLASLKVFAGIAKLPVRVKCAVLAWHTMRAAMRPRAPA